MRTATESNSVSPDEIRQMAEQRFGDMVDDPATRETIEAFVREVVRR